LFQILTSLCSAILCPKDGFEIFYQCDYIFSQCANCGVEKLKVYPYEQNLDLGVLPWCKISYVVGKTSDGWNKKVSRVEYYETTPREMIEYLKPKLKEFVIHNFVAKWQEKEFKAYVPNLPRNTIVFYIDFFENYAFKVQNKTQDMHWFSVQITILMHITYCHNSTFDPTYLVKNPKGGPLLQIRRKRTMTLCWSNMLSSWIGSF
jgi:hypothetical protein